MLERTLAGLSWLGPPPLHSELCYRTKTSDFITKILFNKNIFSEKSKGIDFKSRILFPLDFFNFKQTRASTYSYYTLKICSLYTVVQCCAESPCWIQARQDEGGSTE